MNETRDMIEKYFDLITFYISGVIQLKTFTTFFKGDSGEKFFFVCFFLQWQRLKFYYSLMNWSVCHMTYIILSMGNTEDFEFLTGKLLGKIGG